MRNLTGDNSNTILDCEAVEEAGGEDDAETREYRSQSAHSMKRHQPDE